MKYLKVMDIAINPGSEYSTSSYPGNGLYFVNRRQLVSVASGACYSVPVDAASVTDTKGQDGGGGVSESFIFELIDKTVELVKMQPPRAVRGSDHGKGGTHDDSSGASNIY